MDQINGVLLNKFCCVSFKDEGEYRGNTKLCANVNGEERLYCGFIIGFSPTHWDMCDARTLDDADNIGKLYASRGCKLLEDNDEDEKDVLDANLQDGLYLGTELCIVMVHVEISQQKK